MSFRMIQVDAGWLDGLLDKNAELRAGLCKRDVFIRSLLDPEQLGHAVSEEVRAEAKTVLSIKNDE